MEIWQLKWNDTYDVGSNMFDNMKHCVAIGGADCCWGWGLLPMMAETLGGAGPGPIFNAEAAYSGIWKPVPKKKLLKFQIMYIIVKQFYQDTSIDIIIQHWNLSPLLLEQMFIQIKQITNVCTVQQNMEPYINTYAFMKITFYIIRCSNEPASHTWISD